MSKNLSVHFSSNTNEWATPQDFYDSLDKEFKFTLDPCCTKHTAKCSKFFTIKEDGLSQSWEGETVFCNPPYGGELKDWVEKAYNESKKPGTTVVLLIPARTDTRYFHQYIYRKCKMRFIKGRLKFVGVDPNDPTKAISTMSAPFPSMLAIYNRNKKI